MRGATDGESFARGFRLHLPHGPALDGVEFPSGLCLVIEDPVFVLAAVAPSIEDLVRGYGAARVEWPNTEEGAR